MKRRQEIGKNTMQHQVRIPASQRGNARKLIYPILAAVLLAAAGCNSNTTTTPPTKNTIVSQIVVTTTAPSSGGTASTTAGTTTAAGPAGTTASGATTAGESDQTAGITATTSTGSATTALDHERRPLYVEETVERYQETFEPEFETREADWDGPAGYVIVYSDSTKYAYASARKLQDYFKDRDGVELAIKKDSDVSASPKEILVGNTNRYASSLAQNGFAVSQKDGRLVFEGGHFAMVEKAVDWFTSLDRKAGKVSLLSGVAEGFVAELDGGYEYVWGDEFDGYGVDANKWMDDKGQMLGTQMLRVLTGEEAEQWGTLRVEDGRLKLSAVRYFNQIASDAQYATSELTSFEGMNYLYGYAEIRARLPMFKGTWPSWWCTTAWCPSLFPPEYTYNETPYRLELDIFEVFSSDTDIVPNLHKHWSGYTGDGAYIMPAGLHTAYPSEKIEIYSFPFNERQSYEYHTYGFKWTPEEMTLSVDGEVYMTFDLTAGFDGENEYNQFMQQPLAFNFTNYLFVEDLTAMNPAGKLIDPENLPAEFFIDYIRLYQIPGEGGLWTKPVE